jgi:hypothetical protein
MEGEKMYRRSRSAAAFVAVALTAGAQSLPNLLAFPNATGLLETYNLNGGPIDLTGPFFQSLGSNGRSCATCHQPAQGWSISADAVKARFDLTQGLDPIFRTNDGSTCDHGVDTSSPGRRRAAYSLLIDKGLIRVALPVPATAEFDVISVVNQYGCGDLSTLSMYRRPLPAANLRFLSTVMWDGRESSTQTGTQPITFATNPGDLHANLAHQALDATNGHAEGTVVLTAAQQQAIAEFEQSLITAQAYDFQAGPLDGGGATGGPVTLANVTLPAFFVGINDPLGGNPHGTAFTPAIFDLFDAWATLGWQRGPGQAGQGVARQRQASIARGQTIFNTRLINITGVAGLNDDLQLASIPGTCGTCHDSPNAGNHSVALPINIGVGDLDSPLDVRYLPVITLQNKTTHAVKSTTDPGRALISGRWKDIGKIKGPVLRALSSRAPYFHNGSATTLNDVVDFYDKRFQIGLTPQDKSDLVAFLSAL